MPSTKTSTVPEPPPEEAAGRVDKATVVKKTRLLKPDDAKSVRTRSNGKKPEDVKGGLKDSANYNDEALIRLVNLTLAPLSTLLNFLEEAGIHPDEAHLLGLTKINSSLEAWYWATQIMQEAARLKYIQHKEIRMPLTQILRVSFLLLRRSLPGEGGNGFEMAAGLAREQQFGKLEEEVPGEKF
ncbi:MAG: hypothetical protein JRN35_06075 [Nitrososphaerota archaeon]|nr:hypothetical protein [Nitrososphaerota archaeon]